MSPDSLAMLLAAKASQQYISIRIAFVFDVFILLLGSLAFPVDKFVHALVKYSTSKMYDLCGIAGFAVFAFRRSRIGGYSSANRH